MTDQSVAGLMLAIRRATSSARLYGLTHELTVQACEEVRQAADVVSPAGNESVLAMSEESLFVNGQVLATTSLEFNGMIRDLKALDIHAITLRGPVAFEDATALIEVVAGGVDEYRGGPSVLVNDVSIVGSDLDHGSSGGLRSSYSDSLEVLRRVGGALHTGEELDLAATAGTVTALLERAVAEPSAALLLATVKSHHEYTFYHSVNTCILSLSLGRLLGLPEDQQVLLGMGALLHDIGKIGVSTAILQHPGRLDETQWSEVRKHPQLGAEAILGAAKPGQEVAAAVALEHHARFDGSGYPRLVYHDHAHGPDDHHGGHSHPLHLFSRLVAVADTYDAITTRRSYRRAESPTRALHVLLEAAGTSYDPDFVLAFVQMMGLYPPGSFLRLENGVVAMVTESSDDPALLPKAVAVRSAQGIEIEMPEPVAFSRVDIVEHLTAGSAGLRPTEILERLGRAA